MQTYPELLADAARILAGLRSLGLAPGAPVIFQLDRADEFIPAFWACALGGFLPAPVSVSPTYEKAHSALEKLRNTWELLGRPVALVGATLLAPLRAFAGREGWGDFRAEPIGGLRRFEPAKAWHAAAPEDLALLLLTSGSTGLPKAVGQTQRNLLAWATSVAYACEFSAKDISLNWMPLDHVGGLVMFHLRDVVLGCRQMHAPTEAVLRRPLVWLDWIERYRATITWAPNFAFGLVNDHAAEIADRRWDLSSMTFILNGGEAIVSKTARRFLEILSPHGLPATAMRPAWGMSETCSGVTYSRRFTLATTSDSDTHVEVGEAIPGVDIRIVDSADVAVPAGSTGRLQIRGISVTPGYYCNPEATRQAFTADGWFVTGDLGRISDGQLVITGREKDVIIVNGANFYSHEIEALVEMLPGVAVSFTAACAVHLPGESTDRLAIFFCAVPDSRPRLRDLCNEIRMEVISRQGVAPDFIVPLEPAEIPKTSIGKIQRSRLREAFEQGRFSSRLAGASQSRPGDVPLFTRIWVESASAAGVPLNSGSRILLFADPKLGAGLASRLRGQGHKCVVVLAGADFRRLGADDFCLNPANSADYGRLLEALSDQAAAFTHTVHAWAYPAALPPASALEIEARQDSGSLSLLRLLRTWTAASEPSVPVRLVVVTSGAQLKSRTDSFDFVKTPLLGVLRTVPHECAWLETLHLDLDGIDVEADLDAVAAELATPGGTGEALVRDGRRYVPRLVPAEAAQASKFPVFPEGGIYVLSGGLGAIGRLIAPHLAARKGKILILGRAPFSGRPQEQEDGAGAVEASSRSAADAVGALEAAGVQVRYEGGNLTDPAFVRGAVNGAVEHWGEPVRAVFHLAGEYHEARLCEESDSRFLDSLRPKLLGAWALGEGVRDHPSCLFVGFSSLLGYFGALGTGAYAAANAALDGFVLHQCRVGGAGCSVLWSLWADTGMGRAGNSEILRARGFASLTPERAISALDPALESGAPLVLVGLEHRHRALRAHLDPSAIGLEDAVATEFVAPRTGLEREVAKMWEDVLGVPRVGLSDNFFSLGGRSLLAARLFARIDEELGIKLPLATLFSAPTLEGLVAKLGDVGTPAQCRALPIQTRGGRPPFFCIPGGGSDAIVFQDLARELGFDQPFYGLQAPGLDAVPVAGPFPSVEEVAADFIKVMQGIQPRGPYHFGGHCFGSLLAWEVAVQLKARDLEVGLVALLDPTVSDVFSDDVLGWDRIAFHGRRLMRLSLADKFRYFGQRVRNFSRTMIARRRIAQSVDQAHSMHQRYRLGPYPGPLVVFLAEDSFRSISPERDPRRYYERLAGGGTRYITVSGDHDTMLHYPGVEGLARDLQACLPAAEVARVCSAEAKSGR